LTPTRYPQAFSLARISMKYPLATPFTNPLTFSATNTRGFRPSRSRMNSKNRSSVRWTVSEYFFALPQCFSRLPAVENEAQGGDPSMRLSSPAFRPTAARTSDGFTSRMSRVSRIVSAWFARYTSAAAGMNSLAHATRKPAIR
jgi:hypothetical protein